MPKTDELFVVEGYFAVFRLHALGVPAVALMGSSISEEQAALLARHATRLVVLMDGDTAGHKARSEIVPTLAEELFVRAPLLPEGTAPDTLEDEILRTLLRKS
jgi:DNA primase